VHERRDLQASATVLLSDNTAVVSVTQGMECRDQTPMVQDVTTERSTNFWVQAGNLTGFLALGGAGVAVLATPCTTQADATAANPNPPSQPCSTSDQGTTHTAVGAVLTGLGVLAGAAFVYNIVRARDTTETTPATTTSTDWVACGTKPVANAPVTLTAGGVTITGTTNDRGKATLDVGAIASASSDPQSASVTVEAPSGKHASSSISLATAPAYIAWKQVVNAVESQKQKEIFERTIVEVEQGLTQLEHTREPWGITQINLVNALGNQMHLLSECPPMQQEKVENVRGLCGTQWLRVARRFEGLDPRVRRALDALSVAARRQHAAREAQGIAFLQALGQLAEARTRGEGTSVQVAQQAAEERRVAETQERDARREKCRELCRSGRSSCSLACPSDNQAGEGSNSACDRRCYGQEQTCEAGCER
jgi:hypothetical protein